jgi:GTP-binding protein HflX
LRDRRHKAAVPTVALVGYTNAGKTTLFNMLTRESAEASDAPFVTLDPLVRRMPLPDRREVLVSDTVGFIDRLPHTVVAAFRATLEEVAGADLLLHVIDAASPDLPRQVTAVERVLGEVDAADVPRIQVFNKCDLLETGERQRLEAGAPDASFISALTQRGRDDLIRTIEVRLGLDTERVALEFDAQDADDRARIAQLYRTAKVLRHTASDDHVLIEAELPRRLMNRFGVPAARTMRGGVQRRAL